MLVELSEKPTPWLARFVCVVALAEPGKPTQYFEGEVKGEIIQQESGDNGFGYDRIFWIPRVSKTLADLSMEEKNRLSHRAVAVKKAITFLSTRS
jgi:XTP/dITP diphosphohydrolase